MQRAASQLCEQGAIALPRDPDDGLNALFHPPPRRVVVLCDRGVKQLFNAYETPWMAHGKIYGVGGIFVYPA